MKKAKLFTLLALLTVGLGVTGCAMPDFLYTTVEGHEHTLAHYYNATRHWDECTECGERINVEDHVYGEVTYTDTTHSALCSVCGYGLVEEHTYTYVSLNDSSHAKYCEFCSYYVGIEDHNLVLTATTREVYNETTEEDEEVEGHFSRCACGYEKDDFEVHSTDPDVYSADNDEHYKICDVCGCIYERENHSHGYNDTPTDSTHGVYDEDDESGYYGYYTLTYTCEVCGYEYTDLYNLSEEDYIERYPDEPE
ncbi:MAG: hypothetical protein LUD22_00500 [Coprobacillus sp.]|nr:hypothetical protein [Coprobacillus sp.]